MPRSWVRTASAPEAAAAVAQVAPSAPAPAALASASAAAVAASASAAAAEGSTPAEAAQAAGHESQVAQAEALVLEGDNREEETLLGQGQGLDVQACRLVAEDQAVGGHVAEPVVGEEDVGPH